MNQKIKELMGDQVWFQRADVAKIVEQAVARCVEICESVQHDSDAFVEGGLVCRQLIEEEFKKGI